MRYYELKQDHKLQNLIELKGFKGCPNLILDRDKAGTFRKCSNLYVKGDEKSIFPDLLQSPTLMLSEKLYQVLKYYDADVIYKIAILTDRKMKRQEIYRLMLPKTQQVLSKDTIYFKNGWIDKPVLRADIEAGKRIFYISEGITHHLIVTDEVLESILMREMVGIQYEEVSVEKKQEHVE